MDFIPFSKNTFANNSFAKLSVYFVKRSVIARGDKAKFRYELANFPDGWAGTRKVQTTK